MASLAQNPPRVAKDGTLARAALLLCALVALAQGQPAIGPGEYEVKAAFLMNFTKFVDWPATAFADADSPLTICILGEDPFGSAMEKIVDGETAGGRRIIVRRIHSVPSPKTCQELFVSRKETDPAGIVRAAGPGVLTVGDRDGFLRDGGIIAFVVQARHVRFDINLQAANKASLTISARLLRVARTVLR